MSIGMQLKNARINAKLTQEQVADKIGVSRQSISNWENEKNYPDIINVIELSDLYQISLDSLLKGDTQMIQHLEENTDVVKSNTRLARLILFSVCIIVLLVIMQVYFSLNNIILAIIFVITLITAGLIYRELIQRF